MAVSADWYDEAHSIVNYTFEGTWTWDEYETARQHIRSLLDEVDYPVDQIYDFTNTVVVPKNVISKFWRVARMSHPNTSGLIIVIGQNKLAEMLTNTITKVLQLGSTNYDITYITDRAQIDEHLATRRQIHRGQ